MAGTEAVVVATLLAFAGRAMGLVVLIALKLVLCWGAWRGRPGAILTLLLWEATTVVAMLAASGIHLGLRVVGGATAFAAGGLLLAGSGDVAGE